MIFSLDVRRAHKGDCLLVHFGTKDDPCLMMIDGGPADVYEPQLLPRIEQIRTARNLEPGDSLAVDLLMVSHVDDDHIRGILDLTKEEVQKQEDDQPRLLNVLDFWHNSFDEVIDHTPEELQQVVAAHAPTAATRGGMSDEEVEAVELESDEEAEVVRGGLKVLASVEQGFRLRLDTKRLRYPLNLPFEGSLVMARADGQPIDLGGGLRLTVVGPMQPELAELHEKHVAWLEQLKREGKSPPSALAAYVDKSVANLSSIVVLAEVDGRRMLLTGDARGDKVLEGLEMVGLLQPKGTMTVDVLKVPHHGSANNLDDDFFQRVIATHYVFSGDGEHGNPEREALEMLFAARGTEPFVHLTYPVDEIDAERKKDWEKEQAKEKKKLAKRLAEDKTPSKVREDWSDEKHSLAALFAETGFPADRLRIVPDGAAHVIDLLDAVGF